MRWIVVLVALAGCGGGAFDGDWSGTWTSTFPRRGASQQGQIDVTIDGGKLEGASERFTLSGTIDDDGAATITCSGQCWGYDAAGDSSGTVHEVAGHLRASFDFLGGDITVALDLKK